MLHIITEEELREYNAKQIEEIQKYKWIESEKVGYDIGELRAAVDWIRQYSSAFREAYKDNSQSYNNIE